MKWKPVKVVPKIQIKSFVSAFEATYRGGFDFKGENHNFWEFVYVIDGIISVTADDRVHTLKTGDVIFHKPMEFHKLKTINEKNATLLIMSFYLEGDSVEAFENAVFSLDEDSQEKVEQLITFLRKHKPQEHKNNYLFRIKDDSVLLQETANYTELFLVSLLNSDSRPKGLTTRSAMVYKKIINVMKENVENNITIDELAELCGMSTSNLKKVYSMYSVFSIHKYFVKLKIARAIEMLEEGYNVTEISDILGFNNQNYFSIVFKRETSMSPLNYRKSILGK